MNDSTKLEQTLRDTLHDAADHAPLAAPVPLADAPVRLTATRDRRRRTLVAACAAVIAVGLVVAGVALAREDDAGVQVESPSRVLREVSVAELEQADIQVFMNVKATDNEIEVVRAALEASPDVAHFAYLDHDAAYQEFAEIFSCNPDLVDSIQPQDVPGSFRVAIAPEGGERLRATLAAMPGVDAIDTPDDPTTTDHSECSDTLPTQPPTLPPAGEPPADAAAARNAVVTAFTQAWDGANSFEHRRAAMQDFGDTDLLMNEFDQARAGKGAMRAVVDDIAFLTPERAAVLFHLEFQGVSEPIEDGIAVLQDGAWKVDRETVCGMAQRVGVVCSG